MSKNYQGYKDLIVWQKSLQLAKHIYQLVEEFPTTELYGLSSQMKRAVISISSNIAEGSYRSTQKDFRHFLTISFGSSAELESQLQLAKMLKLGNPDKLNESEELLVEIMKMLRVFIQKISLPKN